MKRVSNLFILLGIILGDVMCAVVAFKYCEMLWGARYAAYSAPTWVAFFYGIPYGIGIVVCLLVAIVLRKMGRKEL